jgi:xanthine dehydrogenase accessory factor
LYPLRKQDLATITKWLEKFNTGDTGTLEISQTGMRLVEKTINEDYKLEYKNPHDFTCSIRLGYASTVHIIGGGHCALALSKLMRELGFYVHVYDTRKNLNTFLQNTYAHQKHVLNDYTELAAINEEHRRTYVVIMTFGYRTDEIALRSIINHRFKYVGVLGSKEKMKTLLNNLLQEGISEDLISKIHTPVGLKIYSHTPEEIAVSIAAEIIYTKNKPVTKPS